MSSPEPEAGPPTSEPADEPARHGAPASGAVDPEDWARSAEAGDEDRYLKERPPHWQ